MGKELLPRENDLAKSISTIILCAGEGSRLKEITKTLPKPLIKIETLNNVSILEFSINQLLKLGINQIAIIIGHLGYKINEFVADLKERIPSTRDKIFIIDSENQYKLGPLHSFLSTTKNKTFLNNHNYYIIIPGDTIFDFNILEEVLLIISNSIKKDKKRACLFYRSIEVNELKRFYDISRKISMGEIERSGTNVILKKLTQAKLEKISSKIKVNQIIPILALPYKIINDILLLNSKIPSKTLWEALNLFIKKGNKIYAFNIESISNFYDIDSLKDRKSVV